MADSTSPTHRVYTLIERKKGDEDDTFWLNIGAAWPHKDGKGYNLALQALPLDGKLVIRTIEEPEPEPPKRGKKG